ncbi:MAG: formimidoylglutamase [Prolixibacteraceae bacterium]|nr:formimidoylglutamase [Prolixibacteraceae bacterium]
MDLRLYFDPPDFEFLQKEKKIGKHTLGHAVLKDTSSYNKGGKAKISVALMGVPNDSNTPNKGTAKAPDEIRKHLYNLSNFDASVKIVDMGNLKKGKTDNDLYFALRDIIDYQKENKIVTVILGGGQDLSVGIARAYLDDKKFSLAVADARVDMKTSREVSSASNFVSRILRENPTLFHLQFIGLQSHFVPPATLDFLKNNTFAFLQLGRIRDDCSAMEPVLRNTNFLSFDISAVRHADAPGQSNASPNGFTGEEACMLARYAGLSNRLSTFGLFEANPQIDKSGMTASLAAQIVWYFLEGVTRRSREDPGIDKKAFKQYYVEMNNGEEPLVFYQHQATNRWWIELFYNEGDSIAIACSESDYKQTLCKEIPNIWWDYIRKTERLLK